MDEVALPFVFSCEDILLWDLGFGIWDLIVIAFPGGLDILPPFFSIELSREVISLRLPESHVPALFERMMDEET